VEAEEGVMNVDLMQVVYIHYKGGRYYPICTAQTHEHNEDRDVVYLPVGRPEAETKPVTRPLRRDSRNQDAWRDRVMWPDGVERERFVPFYTLHGATLEALTAAWAK
jgi:hypothetical protein